jgi:hypothetical protein
VRFSASGLSGTSQLCVNGFFVASMFELILLAVGEVETVSDALKRWMH